MGFPSRTKNQPTEKKKGGGKKGWMGRGSKNVEKGKENQTSLLSQFAADLRGISDEVIDMANVLVHEHRGGRMNSREKIEVPGIFQSPESGGVFFRGCGGGGVGVVYLGGGGVGLGFVGGCRGWGGA